MPNIDKQTFRDFYHGTNQYYIPPYQRTITWPKNNGKNF